MYLRLVLNLRSMKQLSYGIADRKALGAITSFESSISATARKLRLSSSARRLFSSASLCAASLLSSSVQLQLVVSRHVFEKPSAVVFFVEALWQPLQKLSSPEWKAGGCVGRVRARSPSIVAWIGRWWRVRLRHFFRSDGDNRPRSYII